MKTKLLLILATALTASDAYGSDDRGWFVRPYVGSTTLNDISGNATEVDGITGRTNIQPDTGIVSGMGVGFRYNQKISSEVVWEYRRNDTQINLGDDPVANSGDYASNAFYLNGHYNLGDYQNWQPYIGGGVGWLQEVDMDIERDGNEISFSGSGQTGYQVFAGVKYDINDQWQLNSEVRYADFGSVALKGEDGATGEIGELEYSPLTVQLGLQYNF